MLFLAERLGFRGSAAELSAGQVGFLAVDLLRALPVWTVVTLDEYHFLVTGLGKQELDIFSPWIRDLMLDAQNPCQFIVTGSTHLLVQMAIDASPRNGIDLGRAVHVQLPLDEPDLVEAARSEFAAHFQVDGARVEEVEKEVRENRFCVNMASVDQVLRGVHPSAGDLALRVTEIYKRDLLLLHGVTSDETRTINRLLTMLKQPPGRLDIDPLFRIVAKGGLKYRAGELVWDFRNLIADEAVAMLDFDTKFLGLRDREGWDIPAVIAVCAHQFQPHYRTSVVKLAKEAYFVYRRRNGFAGRLEDLERAWETRVGAEGVEVSAALLLQVLHGLHHGENPEDHHALLRAAENLWPDLMRLPEALKKIPGFKPKPISELKPDLANKLKEAVKESKSQLSGASLSSRRKK
jgi:hypothetical protein